MGSFSLIGRDVVAALGAAMRLVRVGRRWRTSDAAGALMVDKRSYERLEAAQTSMSVERLLNFADVTDSDALALLTAAVLREPKLAAVAARNKLLLTQALALANFFRDRGEEIADLDVATILAASAQMYAQLGEHLDRRRAMLAGIADEERSSAPQPASDA